MTEKDCETLRNTPVGQVAETTEGHFCRFNCRLQNFNSGWRNGEADQTGNRIRHRTESVL